MTNERCQQLIFDGCQVDLLAVDEDLPTGEVHAQVADRECRVHAGRGPRRVAHGDTDPGKSFPGPNGLLT